MRVSPSHVAVEALTHAFGSVRALQDVTFDVPRGSVLGLIGPNGAGKSTVLSCIAGLMQPQHGHIRLEGVAVAAPVRRARTFLLGDGLTPWEDQSAAWVLDFAASAFGATEAWRDDLARTLAIDALTSQRIGALSKGQRKRVLLALALLVPRPLTLIDEPFEGLDPRQSRAFTDAVRARAAGGRTFILSIHTASDAMRTCDAHLLLHEGRVLAQGTVPALRATAGVGDDAGLEEVFLALT